MIYRPVALSFPLLLLVALLVAIGVAESQPGLQRQAKAELDRYIEHQHGRSGFRPVVRQISQASLPQHFTAALSGASYADSPYYRTTNHYREPADPSLPGPGASRLHFFSEFGRPLPFPPERLWCVLLDPGDLGARRTVFVALHQDLYNAGWIVHEGPAGASDTDLGAALARLGCDVEYARSPAREPFLAVSSWVAVVKQ
jgi:hypothetical protein